MGQLAAQLACGGGGGNGGGDGGGVIDSGTGPDSAINPTSLEGTWMGPARLSPCSGNVDLPGVTDGDIVAPIEITIGALGNVQAVSLNNQPFSTSDTQAQYYAEATAADMDRILLSFPNVDAVPTGWQAPAPAELDAIHGGGIILRRDDMGRATHGFVYIHDHEGCDLVTGVIERDAASVSDHVRDDLNGSWSGRSAQFVDQTPPQRELDLIFDGYRGNWDLIIDGAGGTGSFEHKTSTVETLTVNSADFSVNDSYFSGTLTLSDASTWTLSGLLSPNGDFFGGFAYPDEWAGSWHDVLLTK